MSYMLPRSVYLAFHIDTNRINARNSLPDMNLLEQWDSDGVINIDMSKVAFNEAKQGNNKQRFDKTHKYIYTHTHASTSEEQATLIKIQNIVFPDGLKNEREKNDVEIIFNANKYGCILITNDGGSKKQPGGILGSAILLDKELNIKVTSSEEAVETVRNKIRVRDKQCEQSAKAFGEEMRHIHTYRISNAKKNIKWRNLENEDVR